MPPYRGVPVFFCVAVSRRNRRVPLPIEDSATAYCPGMAGVELKPLINLLCYRQVGAAGARGSMSHS